MTRDASAPRPKVQGNRYLRVTLGIGIAVLVLLSAWVAIALYSVAASTGHRSEPANTPLTEVLVVGAGAGQCASGNASLAWNCSYVFQIEMLERSGVPTLTLQYLNFLVEEWSGAVASSLFSVNVLTSSGCSLGSYNSSTNSWGPSNFPTQCTGNFTTAAPIQSGDGLALATIPRGGLPYSGEKDQLLLIGLGLFAGSVGAPIG
jgi:hypothetical protein